MNIRKYGYDWIVWALFACLPVVVFWQAATSLAEQDAATGGPMRNAAIFPRIVAWVLVGLCIVHALRLVAGRLDQPSRLTATPTTWIALSVTAVFVVFLLVLGVLGYYIGAPLLLIAFMRLLGVGWAGAVPAAAAMTVAVAFVFEGLLNVVLPLGIWKFTLFG